MLEWILRVVDATESCHAGYSSFQKFEFDVKPIFGIKNQFSDALSQLRTGGTDTSELENGRWPGIDSLVDQGAIRIKDN